MQVKLPIVLLSLIVGGCSRDLNLHPRILRQTEPVSSGFWLSAPHVLVITIRTAVLKTSYESPQDKQAVLQLVEFTADVENVISGQPVGREVRFYFFVDPSQRPRYWLSPKQRYIVSLRRDGKVLRSMADVKQLAIPVHSGRHEQATLPSDASPGRKIAYLLLTPGIDCDISRFIQHLALWELDDYAPEQYVFLLMKRLQTHSDRRLRDAACLATAKGFWFRPSCLSSCLASPDADVRQSAERLVNEEDDKLQLIDRLERDPLSLLPPRFKASIETKLEVYVEDMRPEVRRLACVNLRRMFPQREIPRCK